MKFGAKDEIGLIAEEVQALIPAVVRLNRIGQPDSIDYSRITAVLIGAMQDIVVRLEKLESKE